MRSQAVHPPRVGTLTSTRVRFHETALVADLTVPTASGSASRLAVSSHVPSYAFVTAGQCQHQHDLRNSKLNEAVTSAMGSDGLPFNRGIRFW